MRIAIALWLACACAVNVFAALTVPTTAPVNWAVAVFVALALFVYVEADRRPR